MRTPCNKNPRAPEEHCVHTHAAVLNDAVVHRQWCCWCGESEETRTAHTPMHGEHEFGSRNVGIGYQALAK